MFVVSLRVSQSPLHFRLTRRNTIIGKEIVLPILLTRKMKLREVQGCIYSVPQRRNSLKEMARNHPLRAFCGYKERWLQWVRIYRKNHGAALQVVLLGLGKGHSH